MRAGFNGSMDPQLLAALQDFYEEIILGDGVSAAECDAAVAATAAEIPAEDLQEFLAGVIPHTLFQRPVGADGCGRGSHGSPYTCSSQPEGAVPVPW